MFKQGGSEFSAATELVESFMKFVKATNTRLVKLGLFGDMLKSQGQRENVEQER